MVELVYNLLGKVRIQKHVLQFLEIGDFVVSDPSACGFLVSRYQGCGNLENLDESLELLVVHFFHESRIFIGVAVKPLPYQSFEIVVFLLSHIGLV